MSILLWWLPALVVVAVAWWRLRPRDGRPRPKDLRRLQSLVRSDR